MEEEEEMSPFWVQNTQTNHHRRYYSLIILLTLTVLSFIFIVVPTLHSFTSHFFKPNIVKTSWDSLNLILVLFAIVCGFLTKNNYNTQTQPETETPRFYLDRRNSFSSNAPFHRLRSFNSYPDLRLESPWVAVDERRRFYDDTHLLRCRRPRPEDEEEELGFEAITTVTSVEEVTTAPWNPQPQPPSSPSPPPPASQTVHSVEPSIPQPPPSLSPPPSPHPPPSLSSSPSLPPLVSRTKAVRRNAKPTHEPEMSNNLSNLHQQPSTPPPPPPPPIPAERKLVHIKKKRGTAAKEFLTSLRGKKKKKQRHRSVENLDTILNSEPFVSQSPSSAPPPPPPPPPSVFHNLLFSKKDKHKRRHLPPVATCKSRCSTSNGVEDIVMITGNESPLIPIPPPPPPFKLPAWRFRVKGDFVRIDSIGSSSRSGSPELDEVVDSPISQEGASQCNSPSVNDGGGGLLFCASPDVDTKANTFIERFRAGLKMEKINSFKEKQGIRRSNLGPSSPISTSQ